MKFQADLTLMIREWEQKKMINFKLIEFKNVYISWCVRSLIFVVILFFIATAIDTYHNGRLVYKGSYIFKSIDPEWFFIRLLANYIWLLGPLVFLLGIRTKKSDNKSDIQNDQ